MNNYIKRFLILTIFLSMGYSSFTQDNYPKKLIINGDTVIAQTIDQTRFVSVKLEEGKACEVASAIKDSIIGNYQEKDLLFRFIVATKDRIICDKDSTIADKGLIITKEEQLNSGLKKENKSLKTKNFILTVVAGLLTILAIFH